MVQSLIQQEHTNTQINVMMSGKHTFFCFVCLPFLSGFLDLRPEKRLEKVNCGEKWL